jgi:predicted O-methyltransferase YrrM
MLFTLLALTFWFPFRALSQVDDAKVRTFLESHRNQWQDLNVPYEDGQILYDLIVKHGYTKALEIGTSTGHSTIWIAWAMSKTGGKVTTLEIDEGRHKQAVAYLKELGLLTYVDAQLCDAHERVRTLAGPFDFVFSDADKGWYKQYFIDIEPKLIVGGCFTAHNVRNPYGGIQEFLEHIKAHPDFETTIDKTSRAGISISFRRK